jgi:low affinity Fe/Cu permease
MSDTLETADTQAMQLKLDELICVNKLVRNSLINLEEMSEVDVERLKTTFAALAEIERPAKRPAKAPTTCQTGGGSS